MANKIPEFAYKNREFFIFYMLWFLFHLIMLFSNFGYKTRSVDEYLYGYPKPTQYFWPFKKHDFNFDGLWNTFFIDNRYYDYSEFIAYLIVPVIVFFIWKLATATPKKTS